MSAPKPYRTLFVGTLVQDSAASFGGTHGGAPFDDAFARNGKGELTLRASSLVGALVATARKLYAELPRAISGDARPVVGTPDPLPSRWRCLHAHPTGAVLEARQGVGILQATGAAADDILFDAEATAPGTSWRFCLEVDVLGLDDGARAEVECVAAHSLLEWTLGRCWLGRAVARGMGWMTLRELVALRLDARHGLRWPDNRRPPLQVVDALRASPDVPVIDATDFPMHFAQHAPDARWTWRDLHFRVRAGPQSDDPYGLDGLSVGGHAASRTPWEADRYAAPEGLSPALPGAAFEPDHGVVMTRGPGGALVPVIPGSSVRGSLRHAVSRRLRRGGAIVRDPNDRRSPASAGAGEDVDALFGSITRSGALLVRDAVGAGDWRAAWLQMHAEDEFSGGVYGASRFDRVVLTAGSFDLRMVIEARNAREADRLHRALAPALALAKRGFVPLGGGNWRGTGWLRWEEVAR